MGYVAHDGAMPYHGPMKLVGKPVVIDKLDPRAGAKIVSAVIDDMKRAEKARDERRKKKSR